MSSLGIEPRLQPSQGCVLSVKLRGLELGLLGLLGYLGLWG